ncbi:MAG: type III pantothenate kinase, partial [Hydrogenimonas sp.]|nr:type III pantothenate kinase [Hydrogenimonas sp.]
MILCDIGNSRMHFYDRGEVVHLSYEDGVKQYAKERVGYICVNEDIRKKIEEGLPLWRDVSNPSLLKSDYRGLGIDRIALSLAVYDGVVIDAGSAITVDIMDKGVHLGGCIWPGIKALKKAYGSISPKLAVDLAPNISFEKVPKDTAAAVNYALFASIKGVLESLAEGRKRVITGGDSAIKAMLFPDA